MAASCSARTPFPQVGYLIVAEIGTAGPGLCDEIRPMNAENASQPVVTLEFGAAQTHLLRSWRQVKLDPDPGTVGVANPRVLVRIWRSAAMISFRLASLLARLAAVRHLALARPERCLSFCGSLRLCCSG
jgi:hypothetical protein